MVIIADMTATKFLLSIIESELQVVRMAAKRAPNSELRAVAVQREAQLETELEKLTNKPKPEPVTA